MDLTTHIEADRKRGVINLLEQALEDCDEPGEGFLLPQRPGTDGKMQYINLRLPLVAVEPVKELINSLLKTENEEYTSL